MEKTDSSADKKRRATERAMNLCASREMCRSDIENRLLAWNLTTPEENEQITEELIKEKFIDESRYAAAYARDKLRYNKWGKIKIDYNLRSKLIPEDIRTEALASLDEQEYAETAEKAIASLLKSKKKEDKRVLREKILRSMQGKGFEYEITNAALKKLLP